MKAPLEGGQGQERSWELLRNNLHPMFSLIMILFLASTDNFQSWLAILNACG